MNFKGLKLWLAMLILCGIFLLLYELWLKDYGVSFMEDWVSPILQLQNENDALHMQQGSDGEKYLWYAPHSGFSNQERELKYALTFAMLLNRTLIIPPKLSHFDVGAGSCRIGSKPLSTPLLMSRAWKAIQTVIMESSYISMADICDLTTVSPKVVKTIDLRRFVTRLCGADVDCAAETRSLCVNSNENMTQRLSTCGAILRGATASQFSVHVVEDNCRSTLWTYSSSSRISQSEMGKISPKRITKDIVQSLNSPGSASADCQILSFGSLFSSNTDPMYIAFAIPTGNEQVDRNLRTIWHAAYVREIMDAGVSFVRESIGKPFFCAHLRIGEEPFISRRNSTIASFANFLVRMKEASRNEDSKPVLFLMTDLEAADILSELYLRNWVHLQMFDDTNHLLRETVDRILLREPRLNLSSDSKSAKSNGTVSQKLDTVILHDSKLAIEEVICSCANRGFFSTRKSSISGHITHMRANDVCPIKFPHKLRTIDP